MFKGTWASGKSRICGMIKLVNTFYEHTKKKNSQNLHHPCTYRIYEIFVFLWYPCEADIVGSCRVLLRLSPCFKTFSPSKQQNMNKFFYFSITSFTFTFILVSFRISNDQSHCSISWLWLLTTRAGVSPFTVQQVG